jgi:anti-sigma factor RsiW
VNQLAHNEVQGLYSAYVDHELPAPELERFVQHLEECEGCMEGLEKFEATVEAVRGVPRERAPNSFARQVMRRVKHRNRREAANRPFLDGAVHIPAGAIIPIIVAAALALLIHALQ